MAHHLGTVDRETPLLPPPPVQEWLPERHLAPRPETLGRPTHLLGDHGFHSTENVADIEAAGLELLLALGRDRHSHFLKQRQDASAADRSGPPPEATAVERMAHRLKTSAGRSLSSTRKATVEPVFGQIKQVTGFRQFQLRGLEKAAGDWCLVSIAWNLKRRFKLHEAASQGALRVVMAYAASAALLHRSISAPGTHQLHPKSDAAPNRS